MRHLIAKESAWKILRRVLAINDDFGKLHQGGFDFSAVLENREVVVDNQASTMSQIPIYEVSSTLRNSLMARTTVDEARSSTNS